MLVPLDALWPATTIVAGGSSFTMSFIRASMSPMRLLFTKCDDVLQSDVMGNFSEPGVAERTRNEKPMSDGGDPMTYSVGAAREVTGVGGGVTEASRRSSNRRRRGSNRSSRGKGDDFRRTCAVDCDCRVGSARVRAVAEMLSVTVAAVVVTTVVAAAVATLLLLGAAVSVVVKMGAMQTAPTASSRDARR